MPQHLWQTGATQRMCDACEARQQKGSDARWRASVGTICPGDGRDSARRIVVIGGGGATQKASDRLEVA